MENDAQIMSLIAERLQAVQARIGQCATAVGRAPDTVSLLAVSKAQHADAIRTAYQGGQVRFGENYLQEAIAKQALLTDLPLEWHFIGPIQSNKTQQIAQHFDWVHGVDREKIAERLHVARPESAPPLQVCIQVNVSAEDSKSGIALHEVDALAQAIRQLPRLTLRGLMAIPAPTSDIQLQHKQFRMVRDALARLNAQGHSLDTLSMGMSEDFPAAIAEGATIVRVGTAIFGARH